MNLWRSPRLGKSGRSPLVNARARMCMCACACTHPSQPGRSPLAAEHDDPPLLEVASVEDCVQNRDGRSASDPPRRGNSSAPPIRQLFQAADGGDLVGHHLVALNSWDASTVQPKRFLRRRPSGPTTRMRRWLCWGSSATHRPWHTPEAGTVQMLSVFVVGRACVVSKGPSVSSKVWELSLSRAITKSVFAY